ncbi:uncharacterized protein LOC135584454 isoform X1 [Musa acuminata AAA Group]|uniref:uncharacterized protein LOC103998502 isoform X1 n=1 Tax=Musa acuminata AAA Group TaxID=214697 RepID=UPI0031D5FF72
MSCHGGVILIDECSCISYVNLASMGCCLGIQAETRSNSERTLMSSFWRDQSSRCWIRQWSSSSREMENDFGNFNSLDAHRPLCLTSVSKDMKVPLENKNNHPFINQAALAWNEMRQEWVGDQSKSCRRIPREPSISWCSTYDDLLSTSQPFPESIPLSEMVDFLVDIWHEEGLYD